MLEYISVQQASNKWGISKRRIQSSVKRTELTERFVSVMHGQYQSIRQSLRTAG